MLLHGTRDMHTLEICKVLPISKWEDFKGCFVSSCTQFVINEGDVMALLEAKASTKHPSLYK